MFEPFINSVWLLLNSQLFSTLIGTAMASFAGAYGATAFLEKKRRKENWLRELRVTNAAIMVSFEICNSLLSFKKQYVKDLGDRYNDLKERFLKTEEDRKIGKIPPDQDIPLPLDLRTLPSMIVSGERLVKQVSEQISASAKAHHLTGTIVRTVDSLNKVIDKRNEIIKKYKINPKSISENPVPFYFGLPDSNGNIDQSYPDMIEGISFLTDDCIHFSSLLCTELSNHGKKLKKLLGKNSPSVNTPDFTKALDDGLMPDEKNYEEWDKMFVSVSNKKKN